MAGFNIDPNISLGIKPQQAMSLGDMVNLARGIQAYGQAQQINPLEVQRAQAEANVAQETAQPRISAAKSTATKAEIEASQAGVDVKQHYSNVARSLMGGFVTDKDFLTGNKDAMVKKLEGAKAYAKNVLGLPDDVVSQADGLIDLTKNNPEQAYQAIKNGILASQAPATQQSVITPQLTTVNNQPYFVNPAAQTITAPGEGQPQAQPAPSQPAAQPTAGVPDMSKPAHSQPSQLPYPVRKAGTVYNALPQEEEDRKVGSMYRTGLVERQTNLTTSKRNVDEVIKTAQELEKSSLPTSGVLGAVRRNVATWAGDPTYVQLSKDLANAQIANIHAMGGSMDTVAGQQLTKMANGDATYPPEVLIKIARRTEADMTNIDMQATAAQKFANRYGDNNMKAFQQMWAKNADSKIFEGMNIANSDMSAEDKKKAFNDLFGHMSAKEKKIYQDKKNNLQRLMDTGSL